MRKAPHCNYYTKKYLHEKARRYAEQEATPSLSEFKKPRLKLKKLNLAPFRQSRKEKLDTGE